MRLKQGISRTGVAGLLALAVGLIAPSGRSEEPASAPAEKPKAKLTPRVTETLTLQYFGDNGKANESIYGDDDNLYLARNTTYLQVFGPSFDAGLRFDAALFQDPPARVRAESFEPGGSGYTLLDYDNDYRIEKFYATARLDDFTLTGGDFYVSFGKGIILSLIKIDDLGIDNSLRGGRVEYELPRILKATAVAGTVNATNMDPATHRILRDDPNDLIAGARLEISGTSPFLLGFQGVVLEPQYDASNEAEIDPDHLNIDQSPGIRAYSGGANIEINPKPVRLYVEGDAQQHDNYIPPPGMENITDETGHALYGDLSVLIGPVTGKLEGLYYHRWLMEGGLRGPAASLSQPLPYNHMVTLEPPWMVIKSLGNELGGRGTADILIEPTDTQISFYLTTLKYEGGLMPGGEWNDHPPTVVLHPIAKLRQELASNGTALVMDGGYRHEWEENADREGYLWHGSVDFTLPLAEGHTLEAKEELRRHHLDVTEGNTYWVSTATLSYDMVGLWGVSLVHEYSDETEGTGKKLWGWDLPLPEHHFLWALLSFQAPEPLNGLVLRLSGGAQRGGIKCAAGICRYYPETVGIGLETVYRY